MDFSWKGYIHFHLQHNIFHLYSSMQFQKQGLKKHISILLIAETHFKWIFESQTIPHSGKKEHFVYSSGRAFIQCFYKAKIAPGLRKVASTQQNIPNLTEANSVWIASVCALTWLNMPVPCLWTIFWTPAKSTVVEESVVLDGFSYPSSWIQKLPSYPHSLIDIQSWTNNMKSTIIPKELAIWLIFFQYVLISFHIAFLALLSFSLYILTHSVAINLPA